MRKSTVTTQQDTAGSYETEIFDCPTPISIIIGVHGNGVRRWDGEEFFYQAAGHYADSAVLLADLNQQQDNGVQINPLPILISRVQAMISHAQKAYPDVPIVLIGHSMGCGVIALLDLQNVKAVFFVAPAVGTPQAELIQRYGPEISQGKTVVSSDGLTKIITADYYNSVSGINWEDEYIKLLQRFSPVYVYEAGADEILDDRRYAHRDMPFTTYDIIQGAKHNISGPSLQELFNKMDPIIERLLK